MITDSAKHAVEQMLFYYYYALVQQGTDNPKEQALESVAQMLNATEETLEHAKLLLLQGNKFIENLDSSILLIKAMEESKTLDMESLQIVRNILELSKEMATYTLNEVLEKSNENS